MRLQAHLASSGVPISPGAEYSFVMRVEQIGSILSSLLLSVVPFRSAEPQPTDASLMERLVQRDADALETLYDRHSRAVFSLVYRITQQRPTAEEVTQDIFLQLWRNARLYDAQRGPLEPWLLTLARNRALDTLRLKREKQRSREDDFGARELVCSAPDPETIADRETRAQKVRGVMAELPAQQRRAIELAYFDGMSHSEIAEKLMEPLGTVKSWIRNGLLKLRQELAAYA
ncbi:MAG TPA: sigma-70 family RNA polymerase sigma factor [Candidatus Acidoferrales bacterium]|nr:sigma-70 family RNA polymerase sigma factor [Candidatus Acidoferrales bacterium]